MLKKIAVALLWLLALVALAFGCWLLALYAQWPLWSVPVLFVGTLVAVWLLLWLRRRWIAWRLRRKLERGMTQPVLAATYAEVDAQWKAGVRTLKESRIGRTGGAMYALPWMMVLEATGLPRARELPLLAHTRLDTRHTRRERQAPEARPAIEWSFLRSSVVLEAGPRLMGEHAGGPGSEWQRILHWLLRTRRREPLNGVVLTVDAGWLRSANDAELADAGQRLRSRLDDLVRVFDARMPVWLVVSGAQAIPGLYEWGMALDESLRDQPFGHTDSFEARGEHAGGASEFLPAAFEALANRLFELRIAQGMHGQPDAASFEMPQRIAELQPRLARLLVPAFDATPYAETPLLRGLYFTAEVPGDGATTSWFARHLFDATLPAQRYGWQPLEHWRHWRRLMRHAAVLAWFTLCGVALAGMLYAWRDTREELHRVASRPAVTEADFRGSLNSDLHALNKLRAATIELSARDQGWRRWMPFNGHVEAVERRQREQFVAYYRREVLVDYLDPLTARSIPVVAQSGTDRELAAWAQLLVRRINLILAAQRGGDVLAQPRIGRMIAQLDADNVRPVLSDEGAELAGELYVHYLAWQHDRLALQAELDVLRADLLQLGLAARSPSWLLAWADLQPGLRPITLADFWDIPPDPDAPRVPAGLTAAGIRAIGGFADELGEATGDQNAWEAREEAFQEHYLRSMLDAWYRFAAAFPEARRQLPDAATWRGVLSSLLTPTDPHLAMLHTMATAFQDLPPDIRPDWVSRAIELDRLVRAATGATPLGLIDKARVTNAIGGAQLRAFDGAAAVPRGIAAVRDGLSAAEAFDQYRHDVSSAVAEMLQGGGSAQQVAADTWAFGHDPAVKNAALWTAQQHFGAMRQRLPAGDVRTDVVWELLRGPLAFALDFAGRSAACQLQQDWEASVLSAVQGVTDTGLADELLYGERGQVPAFMAGPVRHFVDRDATRYMPRSALGQTVPLSGQFYAFVSSVQLKQVVQASARQHAQLAEQERSARAQALQQQAAELEKQQAGLPAAAGAVTVESAPPLVNPGARELPERTTLTLQCATGPVVLDNYNFPSSAVFNWAQASCGDTTIQVRFPSFTLTHAYPGPGGFVDFLRDYATGQRRYTAADFPAQRQAMQQAGVETVTVNWVLSGQQSVIGAVQARERVAAELARAQRELDQLRTEAVPAMPAGFADLVSASVPARIANGCWSPPASPAPAAPVTLAGHNGPPRLSLPIRGPGPDNVPVRRASPPPSETTARAPAQAAPAEDAAGFTPPTARLKQLPPDAGLPIPLPTVPASTPPAAARSTAEPPPAAGAAPARAAPEGGWRVQVGAFADPSAAQRSLEAAGHRYQTRPVQRHGRTYHVVTVGGYADRQTAEHAAAAIGKALSLKPVVLGPPN